jgi:DUF4097 and DUF4098 domain-containing protein YvlB
MRLVLAFVFSVTLAQADVEVDDRITRSVQAKPGGKLVLDAEYGSIDVRAGEVQNVQLELERKVEGRDRADAERILKDLDLTVRETDGGIQISAKFKEGWRPQSEVRGRSRRLCRDGKCLEYADRLKTHHYRILVPREFHLELATSSGGVGVSDLKGSVRAKTSGGSLRFGSIDGPVWGNTSGGSITMQGGKSTAELKTSGGSVRIGSVDGEVNAVTSGGSIVIDRTTANVTARTSGGNVEVKETSGTVHASTSGGSVFASLLNSPSAPCRLTTSGGNITVHLPESAKVELDASASGGSVNTDFPVVVRGTLRRDSLQTAINGGGPLLYLRTSGGSIHLRQSGSARTGL